MDRFDVQIPALSWMSHPITILLSILFILAIVYGILTLVKRFE
ncbi:hypothetical protein ABC345_06480 [Shouchella sp. 1P09AA]